MSKDLTDKQQMIFEFIREKINDSHFPPTVREIGDRFGITVKGAYDHLKAIEKKGYIRTEQNKSRAIVILNDSDSAETASSGINIPLLGRIAAGSPILAEENIEDYLTFPESMFTNGEYFALSVKGDSMIEGGILDGDIAIIKKQNTANNGEIIAALLEDEATLKIFSKAGNAVRLVPMNSAYKPIECSELSILGRLAAVFRKY
ncbi:MAG TPA: transcriptional repressor LexA [Spirochaetota bacterium]|nr:transcriptional repressor LexA [Spirochaetota bacterium]HQO39402.1 transcriptional repressor LexA [Spirochaetota bacterium]